MEPAIIVAYPGSGKTTLTKNTPGIIDLDFGTYRAAHKVDKADQEQLFPSFVRLARYYVNDGYVVLTNDHKLIPWLKQLGVSVKVFVPDIPWDALVMRLYQRETHKGESWAEQFAKMVEGWGPESLDDWINTASKYDVPVYRAEYLNKKILN